MELLSPGHFPDYELIDCGNFEKLERPLPSTRRILWFLVYSTCVHEDVC